MPVTSLHRISVTISHTRKHIIQHATRFALRRRMHENPTQNPPSLRRTRLMYFQPIHFAAYPSPDPSRLSKMRPNWTLKRWEIFFHSHHETEMTNGGHSFYDLPRTGHGTDCTKSHVSHVHSIQKARTKRCSVGRHSPSTAVRPLASVRVALLTACSSKQPGRSARR